MEKLFIDREDDRLVQKVDLTQIPRRKTIPYRFSDKHIEYIRRCRFCTFNFLEGAVRSGKTVDNIFAFAHELMTTPDRIHLATGSTMGNAKLNIAGMAHTDYDGDVLVHRYGPHIFHTDNKAVWDFVNRFAQFNRYTHAPVANYRGEIYNLPFNMNTFTRMFGDVSPDEARAIITSERAEIGYPKNLEEQAIFMVGTSIYEKLVKGYTEKQWGRPCSELPDTLITRLPVRYTYDNSYFPDRYQGIPEYGYTAMVGRMLDGFINIFNEFYAKDTSRKIRAVFKAKGQAGNSVIEEQLLEGIRNITAYAREHEAEFVQMVTKKSQEELSRSLRDSKRELEQALSRIHKLDGIIQRLYEDNIEGKVSNERFSRMSASYEEEQHTLESRVAELKALIVSEKERSARDHPKKCVNLHSGCRIEAPLWRYLTWEEEIAARRNRPGEKRSGSFCSSAT